MHGDAFRFRPGVGEQARRACVAPVSLERRERLIDGRADEWMDERQRRLRAQHVDPRERVDRLERRLLVQVGQRRSLAGLGVVEIATACATIVASGGSRERRRETAREPARAPSSGRRGTFASVGAKPSATIAWTSSRKSSGLPAVSSQQVAQKASSASGERVSRRSTVAASALRGAGRITTASGSETIWPTRPGSSPGSSGCNPTTIRDSRPSIRGRR